PVKQVIRHRQIVVGVGGAAELLRRLGHDAVLAHQFGHGVDAADLAVGVQLGVHARAAVTGLDLAVDGPDLDHQAVTPLLASAGRAPPPGVVAGGGDLQRVAEQAHGPSAFVFLNGAEGHVSSRAKNAAAFFRMSRSARSRWFSARRRRFSSSKGESLPWPGKACSPLSWKAWFQLRIRFSLMPRERAASAKE